MEHRRFHCGPCRYDFEAESRTLQSGDREGGFEEQARPRERGGGMAPGLEMGAPCPRCGGWVTAGDAPTELGAARRRRRGSGPCCQ